MGNIAASVFSQSNKRKEGVGEIIIEATLNYCFKGTSHMGMLNLH